MARITTTRWRRSIGFVSAGSALLFSTWLVLALFSDIPTPEISVLDQSGIRLLAELTVVCLLIAAVAFWEEPLA